MTSDFTEDPADGTRGDDIVGDDVAGDSVDADAVGDATVENDTEESDGPGDRAPASRRSCWWRTSRCPRCCWRQVLERPRHEIDAALRPLAAEYTADGLGCDLLETSGGGWRFYTRGGLRAAGRESGSLRDGQQARLTQAALETLAVIAYRQPVSRARVSAVRGVNCDGVIRTLVLRGLAEDSGTDPESGAILYRTTGYFLERLGMASLDELPDLAPFLPENIEDIEDNERTRA